MLAFLDMVFRGAVPFLEGDDSVGGSGQVGQNESDLRIHFAGMPFDLSRHSVSLAPVFSLIAEVNKILPNLVERTAPWTKQQVVDTIL